MPCRTAVAPVQTGLPLGRLVPEPSPRATTTLGAAHRARVRCYTAEEKSVLLGARVPQPRVRTIPETCLADCRDQRQIQLLNAGLE